MQVPEGLQVNDSNSNRTVPNLHSAGDILFHLKDKPEMPEVV